MPHAGRRFQRLRRAQRACRAVSSALRLETIQAILGHAQATTTNRYLRRLEEVDDARPHLQLLTSNSMQRPNSTKKGPNAVNV